MFYIEISSWYSIKFARDEVDLAEELDWNAQGTFDRIIRLTHVIQRNSCRKMPRITAVDGTSHEEDWEWVIHHGKYSVQRLAIASA